METQSQETSCAVNFNEEWANQWIQKSKTLELLQSAGCTHHLKDFQDHLGGELYEKVLRLGTQILLEHQLRGQRETVRVVAREGRGNLYKLMVPGVEEELMTAVREGIAQRAREFRTGKVQIELGAKSLLSGALGLLTTSTLGYKASDGDCEELQNILEVRELQSELDTIVKRKMGVKTGVEVKKKDEEKESMTDLGSISAVLRAEVKSKKVLGRL